MNVDWLIYGVYSLKEIWWILIKCKITNWYLIEIIIGIFFFFVLVVKKVVFSNIIGNRFIVDFTLGGIGVFVFVFFRFLDFLLCNLCGVNLYIYLLMELCFYRVF